MTLNKKNAWGGVSYYETPLVKTLDILSEGVLCMSSPNSTIDNAIEDDWGTL
jgi:hypothetical protein